MSQSTAVQLVDETFGASLEGVRIAIVDDQAILREGLAALLETRPGLFVVSQHSSVREVMVHLGTLAAEAHPNVLLLDLVMPGASAFSLISHVKNFHPHIKVICLTGFPTDERCQKAFQAGADAFVSKCIESGRLAEIINRVTAGSRVVFTPDVGWAAAQVVQEPEAFPEPAVEEAPAAPVATRSELQVLTRRELEVLQLIGRGCTAKVIAKELSISKRTVDRHKTNIMSKLKVSSQFELALRYHRLAASTDPSPSF